MSEGIFRRIPKKVKKCTERYMTELDEQSINKIPSAAVKISHSYAKAGIYMPQHTKTLKTSILTSK